MSHFATLRLCGKINDFWIGYLLLGYQSEDSFDPPEEGARLGVAPPAGDPADSYANNANNFLNIPLGSDGAMIFLETMRDVDKTNGANVRIQTAPHELGHQFGLGGDDSEPQNGWGLMGYTNSYEMHLVPSHIKILRFRSRSPGQ